MNPYKQWLGIATDGHPDHFQLLGLSRGEQDLDTIKASAEFQLRKIKKHQSGEHEATAQQLADRIKKAYRIVSNPDLRQDYLELLIENEQQIDDNEIVIPISRPEDSSRNSFVTLGLMIVFGLGCLLLPALTIGACWMAGLFDPSDSPTQPDLDSPLVVVQTESDLVPKTDSANSTDVVQAPEKQQSDFNNGDEKESSAATEVTKSATEDPTLALAELDGTQEFKLAHEAMTVLKTSCYSCHGEAGEDEGGFDFVLDREELVSTGYIVPRNPDESVLMQRITSVDSPMPPEGEEPRPNSDQIEILNRWILAGAPNTSKPEVKPYISPADLYASVAADLKQFDRGERKYIRYFSNSHLANAGASTAELETDRQALAKLLNSLSWSRELAKLKPLANQPTVFQIDLRDLKWTEDEWELLMLDYRYGVVIDSADANFVREDTQCELPILRGDWFVGEASRPPLYHELLRIPDTDSELERLLQVDVKRNIRESKAQRIGFARSGVSQNNRLIERHESAVGAYWKSYDFGGNTGRKNLFENPLGPGLSSSRFEHDGGEIIFQLPNGMLGYMLTDADGQRIDRGPTEIVSDPRQPDRAVINGVSCMSCHYGGFIQKTDEIRGHVASNPSAFKSFNAIMELYPESQDIDPKLYADTKKYLVALASDTVGIEKPTRNGEPVVLVSNRFGGELDATLAAAELGLTKADFVKALVDLGDDDLARTVGVLRLGGVVKRETFEDVFTKLVNKLELGRPPQASSSAAARRRLAARKRASRIGISESQLKARNETAKIFLQNGDNAAAKELWKDAGIAYENAIRATPDPDIHLKAYKKLIPIYERTNVPRKLIRAHQFVLGSISEPREMEVGVQELYASVIRQVFRQSPAWKNRQTNQTRSWQRRSRDPRWGESLSGSTIPGIHEAGVIIWDEVRLPASTKNIIASTFESELNRDPFHEPALLVLDTHYSHVSKNDARLKKILTRLEKLRRKRGEEMAPLDQMKLAHTLFSSGNYYKAAELWASVNQSHARSAGTLRTEAMAWEKANQKPKAISILKESLAAYKIEGGSDYNITAIADAFVRCGDPESSIEIYADLLENCKRESDIKRLRVKLNKSIALSKTAGPVSAGVQELIDPLREFRIAAEELEKDDSKDPLRRCRSLVKAAKSWSQANETKKALTAINQAAEILRTSDKSSMKIESLNRDIGEVYYGLKENEKAFGYFSASLRLADSNYDIDKDQQSIKRLLDSDNPIQETDEVKHLISPEFKYRKLALEIESKISPKRPGSTSNLIQATEYWVKAKDLAGVTRVGRLVEDAIEAGNNSDKFSHRKELANLYMEIQLDTKAVQQYVTAMDWSDNDDNAV